MIKVYLDNCCYNRLFDEEINEKIISEKKTLNRIFKLIIKNRISLYSSKIIDYEIEQMPESIKKSKLNEFYESIGFANIEYSVNIEKRVEELESYNIKYMDAYHIAFAEKEEVDYFVTVDKLLINRARDSNIKVEVVAPEEFERRCFKWQVIQGGK